MFHLNPSCNVVVYSIVSPVTSARVKGRACFWVVFFFYSAYTESDKLMDSFI